LRSLLGAEAISFDWTRDAALDARDAAFDAGAHTVHVSGLPMIGAACGFGEVKGPLPAIED
jgi:hypothetical protein